MTRIPVKERKLLRDKMIRRLYDKGRGMTMDDIVKLAQQKPEMFYGTTGVSKLTVFFAVNPTKKKKLPSTIINGRSSK